MRAEANSGATKLFEKPKPPFSYFLNYLYLKYDQQDSSGWSRLILRDRHGDENEALTLFFRELNQFVQSKPRLVHHYVAQPKQALRFEPHAPYPSQVSPDEIVLVTFEKSAGTHAYFFKKGRLLNDYQFKNYERAVFFLTSQFGSEVKVLLKRKTGSHKTLWRKIENVIYNSDHRPERV